MGGSVNPIQPLGGAISNLGLAPSPLTAASATQVDPNLQGTQFTPTAINPVTPTFQQQIGAGVIGVDFEFVEYTNESGQTIRLRRNKSTGQMIDPVPAGFTEKVKEETKVETTPTTGVGTQTTQVSAGGDRSEEDPGYQGATVALGGESGTGKQAGLRTGNFDVFGVSFDAPGALPGVAGILGITKGLATGQGLPQGKGVTANVFSRTDPTASVTLTAEQYNSMMATDGRGRLGEQVKTAVDAMSAIRAGEFDKANYNDLTGLSRDLVQRSTVKGLMDNVDIQNPQGIVDNLRNLGTGTFSEAVDKLNSAERAVLEDMGVDLDLSTIGDEPDFAIDPGPSRPSDMFDDPSDFDDDAPAPSAPSGPSPETIAAADAAGAIGYEPGGDGGGAGDGGDDKGGNEPSGRDSFGGGQAARGVARGGLMKQMKRSGLASKK
jgi:hypothetical protein